MPDLLAKWRYKQIALTLSAMLVISVLSVCTHFQVRHWQNSYTLFQHAFGITGDNYTVCRHLAECLNEQNRLDEAIENYQKCLHEIPDSTEVLNNLGIALGKQGKFDEAIKYFEAALRIKPDFAEVHINLGITLAAKGEFAEALRHYKTAAETTDTPRLYSNLGSLLLNIGRFEEAAIAYRKALSATPDDFNVLGKLGCALAHTGKFDEAISVLTKSLQIKPDFAEAHTDLGHVLALSGRPSEAVVHLVEALRLDPRSARTHYYLGQVLMQMDKINEAIAHFEEALQFKPDWAELMNDLSWFLATSEETTVRNPEKAVRYAQQACELTDYKRPEFLDTLAAAYAAAGDFGKAVEIAERALTLCQLPEQKPLKEEIDNRLALYKAGKPYIEAQ
jgi:tetratricopeptide (TPR) repeat protein